jgi:hypothetical protein
LLLALSEDGVHEVIWTDGLLDGWEEVMVREQHRAPGTAAAVAAAIRDCFADSKVERAGYEGRLAQTLGEDVDDQAHMAAAVAISDFVDWCAVDRLYCTFDCGVQWVDCQLSVGPTYWCSVGLVTCLTRCQFAYYVCNGTITLDGLPWAP